jgi:hypothetical protein
VCRPRDEKRLYRIVGRPAHLGDRIGEAMQGVRRLYELNPWPDPRLPQPAK